MLYETLIRPLLFKLDPESAHHLSITALQTASSFPPLLGALRKISGAGSIRCGMPIRVAGLSFKHPVGLAAGFDKNAVALPAWEALGFSFVEAGTVTAQGQPGNPKPRIFRLPDEGALINRLGFNNDGAALVAARLSFLKNQGRWPSIPIGINIGKSKITPLENAMVDYGESMEKLYAVADYFTVNVSSPNTPGLRELQGKTALDELLAFLQKTSEALARNLRINPRPLFLKIAPDLNEPQIEEMLEILEKRNFAGVIATNTTIDKSILKSARWGGEEGGLSGRPLARRSTQVIRFIARRTSGKLPIIGVGGIFTRDDVQQKLDAGACLVQVYTGFVYEGPGMIAKLLR